VGVPLQLAVIEDREEYLKAIPLGELVEKERVPVPFHAIINPQVEIIGDDTAEFFEGCLSLAGFSALVPRARKVRVDYLDEFGEEKSVVANGWYARILQHEIDHLHSTIYIDKMRSRSFTSIENFSRSWKNKIVADVVKALEK
jgi:peptide deformylase